LSASLLFERVVLFQQRFDDVQPGGDERMSLKFRPLSYGLGAEVCGIDVSRAVTQGEFKEVHRAFLDYGVLLLRNQKVSREQHIEFSSRFGRLDDHANVPRDRHPEYNEIIVITNEPKASGAPSDSKYTGRQWHSDLSFTLVPSLGSALRCLAAPPVGGDTMFANMYMAYDTLSDGMKKLIAELHGVHVSERKIVDLSPERAAEHRRLNPPVAQPVVRVHPETGKKALYIGEKVRRFAGMREEESRPLIDYLCRHAARPEFVYRHQWQVDDILIWDNRCTSHIALGDFDETQLRRMERTTILGTPSGYVYQEELH
jgi:taurine dioxygenase